MRSGESGAEKTDFAVCADVAALSPSRITPENNEKIRPQPDRENAFARSGGGGDGSGGEPSPVTKLL